MEGPDQVAELQHGLQIDVHADLGAVFLRFMHGEVEDARSLRAAGERVFLVPGETAYAEALGVHGAVPSVPVDQVEHGVIILLDDGNIKGVFTGEEFVLNPHDLEHARAVDDQHVVQRGAFADGVSLLDAVPGEAFFVNIQRFIGHGHLGAVHGAEGGDFRFPGIGCAVLLAQGFKPADGEFGELAEILLRLFNVRFKLPDVLVRLERVKLGDALDFNFRQPHQVVPGDGRAQLGGKRLQFPVNGAEDFLPRLGIFNGEVNAVFNENLSRLAWCHASFSSLRRISCSWRRISPGGVRVVAQDVAHAHEPGLFLHDDAGVRGDADLAGGEGEQGFPGLLRVHSGREMHQDVHVLGRIVLDAGYFDLPLFRGGDDGINQDFRGDPERNFRDAENASSIP